MADKKIIASPTKAGALQGYVTHTTSTHIEVTEITVKLDKETAWALCNVLHDSRLMEDVYIEDPQRLMLSTLGAALGRMIDHASSKNGGREPLARVD